MRITKVTCDKCNKDITEKKVIRVILPCKGKTIIKNGVGIVVESFYNNDLGRNQQDLCEDCARNLADFVEGEEIIHER